RIKDLLGVQPKLTQVPPVRFRSAKATVCPALAAVIAAVKPLGPPPTTTNSYTSLGRGGRQSVGWPWAIVRRFGASKGAMLAADMSHLVGRVAPEPDRPAEPPAGPPLAEHHAQQRRPRGETNTSDEPPSRPLSAAAPRLTNDLFRNRFKVFKTRNNKQDPCQ